MKKFLTIAFAVIMLAFLAFILLWPDSDIAARIAKSSAIILAILTGEYVVLTYQILRSTRPRPLVLASLFTDEIELLLSVKNIGSRPAYNVRIDFTPSLDVLSPGAHFTGTAEPMLNQPFMPPEFEVRNFISSTLQVMSLDKTKRSFAVNIAYQDANGKKFSDSYHIDLDSLIFEKKFMQYADTHYLRAIAEQLEEMNKHLSKMTRPPAANSQKEDAHHGI